MNVHLVLVEVIVRSRGKKKKGKRRCYGEKSGVFSKWVKDEEKRTTNELTSDEIYRIWFQLNRIRY